MRETTRKFNDFIREGEGEHNTLVACSYGMLTADAFVEVFGVKVVKHQ